MLFLLVYHKHLLSSMVLMDSLYATKDLMLLIEQLDKHYYYPLKSNRRMGDSNAQTPYQRVDSLRWNQIQHRHGKRIKVRGLLKHHKVKLLRAASGNGRIDYVGTNGFAQNNLQLPNRRVTGGGRLSSFTGRQSSWPVLKGINVAWHRLFAITSVVLCWSGCDSSNDWTIGTTCIIAIPPNDRPFIGVGMTVLPLWISRHYPHPMSRIEPLIPPSCLDVVCSICTIATYSRAASGIRARRGVCVIAAAHMSLPTFLYLPSLSGALRTDLCRTKRQQTNQNE